MGALSKIPLVQVAIMVSTVTAVAWIAVPGTAAIIVSVIATGVLALRGASESEGDGEERDRLDDE